MIAEAIRKEDGREHASTTRSEGLVRRPHEESIREEDHLPRQVSEPSDFDRVHREDELIERR